jgi:hypothetical protein
MDRLQRGRRMTAWLGARRLLRAAPALVLAATALTGGTPAPASADHGGAPLGSLLDCSEPQVPPRCVSVGDDARHHVYIHPSVPGALAASVRRAMREAYGPTALRMIEDPAITRRTDVIVYAADHGANGAAGWVYCPEDAPQGVNARGDRWCRHQELHFNLNASYAAFFGDDDSRTHLACHEIGHTVGLRHWGNPPITDGPTAATCMNADTPNGPTTLHRFDRDHIDAYYAPPRLRLAKRCASEF